MADQIKNDEAKTSTEAAAPAATPVVAAKADTVSKPAPRAAAEKAAKPVRKTRVARTTTRRAKAATSKPAAAPVVKKSKPARAGATQIKGAQIMVKQTRNGADAGLFAADQFKTVFGDVNERAKAAAERSAKVVEELSDLTRGNVEAFVASSRVAAKAVETLSQDAAEYGRKHFEEASTALKTFAEAKSPTDFFKLQSDFARAAFDSAVAESARLSENMLKIAGEIAQPINNRYTVAAERVKSLAA